MPGFIAYFSANYPLIFRRHLPLFTGIIASGLAGLSGFVAVLLVAHYLSAAHQGYFYVFISIASLQYLLECGVGTCVTNYLSHYQTSIRVCANEGLSGDKENVRRICCMLNKLFLIYFCISILISTLVAIAGYNYLSNFGDDTINWKWPWFLMCVATSTGILILPFFSFLEGLNKYLEVNIIKIINRMSYCVLLFLCFWSGAELFAMAIAIAVSSIICVLILVARFWRLLLMIFSRAHHGEFRWRYEIWPMQWRIMLSFIFGFITFHSITPILFATIGPIQAGKYGMTMAIINSLSLAATQIIHVKVAHFGELVSTEQKFQLERSWKIATLFSMCATLFGLTTCFLVFNFFPILGISESILPHNLTFALVVAAVVNQLLYAINVFFRAHRQEPLVILSMFHALILILCTALFANLSNLNLVVYSQLIIMFLVSLMAGWTFLRFNKVISTPSF